MVLEDLDAVGCMGILATHLHGVLDMELRTRHVARMAMGTVVEDDVSGRPMRRATWKMVDGEVGRHFYAFRVLLFSKALGASSQYVKPITFAVKGCKKETFFESFSKYPPPL
jgi:hypothetical protein